MEYNKAWILAKEQEMEEKFEMKLTEMMKKGLHGKRSHTYLDDVLRNETCPHSCLSLMLEIETRVNQVELRVLSNTMSIGNVELVCTNI